MLLRLPQLGTYAKETSAEGPRVCVFSLTAEAYPNHVLCGVVINIASDGFAWT
jgi:hypothetical protein